MPDSAGKRTALGAGVALAAALGTWSAAPAATTHQYAYYGSQPRIDGEAWFNSGACRIPRRGSFTVKDRGANGTRIRVHRSGARTGNHNSAGRAGSDETTFGIDSDNVASAVGHSLEGLHPGEWWRRMVQQPDEVIVGAVTVLVTGVVAAPSHFRQL
ncbi:hypothetical protein [Micromonospora rubida]